MMKYTSRVIRPECLTEEEISRWHQLLDKTPALQRAFLSYFFARAVASTHPLVRVAVVYQGAEIISFIPFQFRNRCCKKLGIAERVGGGMSDYFGIIARRDVSFNNKDVCTYCKINYLEYTHLDESQLVHGFHVDHNKSEKGLMINIGPSSETYFSELKAVNKKIISDTARRIRRVESSIGPLRFHFSTPEKRQIYVLDHLIARKREQYARTKKEDSLELLWRRNLLQKLLTLDEKYCRGVLSTLYAGETWVASHFGLQSGNRLHYWFPVYNTELAKYSPGRLLMQFMISSAPDQNNPISIIDRGAGISKAKLDFANDKHNYFRGEFTTPGIRSTSYNIFRSLKWRWQSK